MNNGLLIGATVVFVLGTTVGAALSVVGSG
jgi:hypothetical protein